MRSLIRRLSGFVCLGFLIFMKTYSVGPSRAAALLAQYRNEYCKLRNHLISLDERKNHEDIKNEFSKASDEIWSLVGKWACIYLTDHPEIPADELAQNIKELEPRDDVAKKNQEWFSSYQLNATAVRLLKGKHAAYAVSVNSMSGTFFVVARTDRGNFYVAWNIKEVAASHFPSGDEIGRWAYMQFAYTDGPLVGRVFKLPAAKNGAPRFCIDATALTFRGEQPRQIGIWEWNGTEATPLLISSYRSTGYSGKLTLLGQQLKVPTKGEYETFFACGSCPEPVVIWTIGVSPTGVIDLGRSHEVPELQKVDELWNRVLQGKEGDQIASSQVLAEIKKMIKEENLANEKYSLSMLGNWQVIKKKNFTILRLTCGDQFQQSFTGH